MNEEVIKTVTWKVLIDEEIASVKETYFMSSEEINAEGFRKKTIDSLFEMRDSLEMEVAYNKMLATYQNINISDEAERFRTYMKEIACEDKGNIVDFQYNYDYHLQLLYYKKEEIKPIDQSYHSLGELLELHSEFNYNYTHLFQSYEELTLLDDQLIFTENHYIMTLHEAIYRKFRLSIKQALAKMDRDSVIPQNKHYFLTEFDCKHWFLFTT